MMSADSRIDQFTEPLWVTKWQCVATTIHLGGKLLEQLLKFPLDRCDRVRIAAKLRNHVRKTFHRPDRNLPLHAHPWAARCECEPPPTMPDRHHE